MTSGFRRDNLPSIAKTNDSGWIGLERLAVKSVKVDEVLPENLVRRRSIFFARSSLDLCETTRSEQKKSNHHWICAKLTRFEQKTIK